MVMSILCVTLNYKAKKGNMNFNEHSFLEAPREESECKESVKVKGGKKKRSYLAFAQPTSVLDLFQKESSDPHCSIIADIKTAKTEKLRELHIKGIKVSSCFPILFQEHLKNASNHLSSQLLGQIQCMSSGRQFVCRSQVPTLLPLNTQASPSELLQLWVQREDWTSYVGCLSKSFGKNTEWLAACTVFHTCLQSSTLQGTAAWMTEEAAVKQPLVVLPMATLVRPFLGVFGQKVPFLQASVLGKNICYQFQIHFLFIPAALASKKEARSSLLIIQGKQLAESSTTAGKMSLNLYGWIKIGL